jgi:hypothetical protein
MIQNINELKEWSLLGERLIRAFHTENLKFSNYTIPFEQLRRTLESRRGQKSFIRNFGGTIAVSGTSESDAIQAMKNLARLSHGKIPSVNVAFTQAIVDKATAFSFIDAAIYTTIESAKDIGKTAQAVGDTLINTGKILRFIFIPAFFLILGFYIYKRIK